MKRFLTLFVVAVIGAAMVSPAFAQGAGPAGGPPKPGQGRPGGERGGGMMMRGKMKEIETRVFGKLGLNDKQKAAIKALDAKVAKDTEALRKTMKPGTRPDQATMEKMRAIGKSRQEGLNKILTTAQQAKYKSLMAEEMKKLRAEREKSGGGKPGQKPGQKPGASKP